MHELARVCTCGRVDKVESYEYCRVFISKLLQESIMNIHGIIIKIYVHAVLTS